MRLQFDFDAQSENDPDAYGEEDDFNEENNS